MRDFTKYDVWNDSIELAKQVYHITQSFPSEEKFGLVSQIRRSSISISSNIAEGCRRSPEKDFRRFIEIPLGLAFELRSQLIVSDKLGFCKENLEEIIFPILEKISKQLNALRTKLGT